MERLRGWRTWHRLALVGALLLIALVSIAQARTAAKPHVLKCRSGTIRVFHLAGAGHRVVTPKSARQLPPRGAKQACLRVPSLARGGATVDTEASQLASHAFGRLPAKTRRRLSGVPGGVAKLVRSFASRHRSPLLASEAAGRARNETDSIPQSSQSQDLGGGTTATVTAKADIHSDDCPTSGGKVENGGVSFRYYIVIRAAKLHVALTIEFTVAGTFTGEVGDDGQPSHLTASLHGEKSVHMTAGTAHDYYRQDGRFDVDLPLPGGQPDISGATETTNGDSALGGQGDAITTIIAKIGGAAVENLEAKPWQIPGYCTKIELTPTPAAAKRGGQISLAFRVTAGDGRPVGGTLKLSQGSCVGQLSATSVAVGPGGTGTAELTDPSSQWVNPNLACIDAKIQTHSGKDDHFELIPIEKVPVTRLTGTLDVDIAYSFDDGSGSSEHDHWTGTASIDERIDPSQGDSGTGSNVHNSSLLFNGSWSNSDGTNSYSGSASGSTHGLNAADPYSAGTSADLGYTGDPVDPNSVYKNPPGIKVSMTFPGQGSDAGSDCGSTSGPMDLLVNVVTDAPPGGTGTVPVNQDLKVEIGGGRDNGWLVLEPSDEGNWSCSGSTALMPNGADATAHIGGSLTVSQG